MDTDKLLADIAERSPKDAARLQWEFSVCKMKPMEIFQLHLKAMRKGEFKKAQFLTGVYQIKRAAAKV